MLSAHLNQSSRIDITRVKSEYLGVSIISTVICSTEFNAKIWVAPWSRAERIVNRERFECTKLAPETDQELSLTLVRLYLKVVGKSREWVTRCIYVYAVTLWLDGNLNIISECVHESLAGRERNKANNRWCTPYPWTRNVLPLAVFFSRSWFSGLARLRTGRMLVEYPCYSVWNNNDTHPGGNLLSACAS